jgi:hypothetical protein
VTTFHYDSGERENRPTPWCGARSTSTLYFAAPCDVTCAACLRCLAASNRRCRRAAAVKLLDVITTIQQYGTPRLTEEVRLLAVRLHNGTVKAATTSEP